MSMLDKIESIEFNDNKNKIFNIKSGILWGINGNTCFPLVYISKPKSVSQDDFEDILSRIDIDIHKEKIR